MNRSKRCGFTLIELLTVIVIIMILMAAIAPVLGVARNSARKKRAKTELVELVKAWEMYRRTYSNWPSTGANIAMTADMVNALSGVSSADNTYELKFMDFPRKALTEGFKDPWGELYSVTLSDQNIAYTWDYETRVYCRNKDRSKYE